MNRHPLHSVVVAGVYNTRQARRLEGHDSASITLDAIQGVLADAGLSPRDVDGFCIAPTSAGDWTLLESATYAYQCGIPSCWTGSHALNAIPAVLEAAAAIAFGQCHTVLIANGEAGLYQELEATAPWTRPANEFVECWGLFTAAEYALVARRHMAMFGTTPEQMAYVASVIRNNGHENPEAAYFGRGPYSPADVLESRMVADPLHLLDCAMTSEGGAAVILTRADRARDMRQRPVYLLGGCDDACGPGYRYPPTYEVAGVVGRRAARTAFAMAGLGPDDVDVCEIYDPCSFEIIRQFEAFGFCAEGEGGPFVESGVIERSGRFPVCTDGGTMAHSHTRTSQTLQKVVQAVRQVRGDAPNQIPAAGVAMTSTGGSATMYNPVLIVGAETA